MSCTAPETYYTRDPKFFDGKGGFTKDPRRALSAATRTVPCGRCIDCRLQYARDWSLRCMHEAQTSGDATFVTLTYDPEHLPVDWCLDYRHFQLFMHKLRKSVPGGGRFFMCGEYGDLTFRPHYHAILFNCVFPDKKFHSIKDGITYYTSEKLSKLWGNGFCLLGDVTLASAGYVARYNTKKITGDAAAEHYRFVTPDGVVVDRPPPFAKMSLKPGIGYEWFMQYHADLFPADFIVYQGARFPVPRYYKKLLERLDVCLDDRLKKRRRAKMVERRGDIEFTPRRLYVKNELRRLVSDKKREME